MVRNQRTRRTVQGGHRIAKIAAVQDYRKAEAGAGLGSKGFLGDYNNGTLPLAPGAIPYHKGFLRGEWNWKGLTFVATGNYISSYNDDSAFVAEVRGVPVEVVGGTFTNPQYNVYRRVSDYTTLDMQLSYEFVKPEMEAAATTTARARAESGRAGGRQCSDNPAAPLWRCWI